jgi:hypothetical protein
MITPTTEGSNGDGDRRGFRAMFAASQKHEGEGGGGGSSSSNLGSGGKLIVDLRESFRKLESSHRLSMTSCGSDLGQLYLSSPEVYAVRMPCGPGDDVQVSRRVSSWLIHAADPYGRRRSFRRISTYERFLDYSDAMDDIHESDEERIMVIEEETGDHVDNEVYDNEACATTTKMRRPTSFGRRHSPKRMFNSPSVVVPTFMTLDLILGVSLSLFDSNLLKNVPGFRFPLCYALTQKLTNAVASLALIFISRRWKAEKTTMRRRTANTTDGGSEEALTSMTEFPSARSLRRHATPLAAVALAQSISASFANRALLSIPLSLFKVCLMCGPIFVALMTSAMGGTIAHSRGRSLALSMIGVGACRAVYAEAGGADDPRSIMIGAGYALGASAFSGLGLVMSGLLMHHREGVEERSAGDVGDTEATGMLDGKREANNAADAELNPLSLLFYLSCGQVLMLGAYLCPRDTFSLQLDGDGEGLIERNGGELAEFIFYFIDDPFTAIYYLSTGSVMSLSLAVITFILVNKTSPVATSLLGNVRSIATVFVSSLVFGGGAGLGSIFGYTLTLAGGIVYALSALRDNGPPS